MPDRDRLDRTEINVTSPNGIQEIARFDGAHIERAIWDSIETTAAARGG